MRFIGWLLFSVALFWFVAETHPQQRDITIYKLSLATLGAVMGYWVSRAATTLRVGDLLARGESADAALGGILIYRGLCISCGMLALSLGA